jgi:hypothetical protein
VDVRVVVSEAGNVSVAVAVPVGVSVTVEVGVMVRVNVAVKVGGRVVRVSVGVWVGEGVTVPRYPQKGGRLPGSTLQAIKDDNITRQRSMFR